MTVYCSNTLHESGLGSKSSADVDAAVTFIDEDFNVKAKVEDEFSGFELKKNKRVIK